MNLDLVAALERTRLVVGVPQRGFGDVVQVVDTLRGDELSAVGSSYTCM